MAKNTPIKHVRSSVSGAVPAYTSLEYGELGINYSDGALYFRDTGDNVIPVASVNNNLVTGEYLFATSTSATDPGSGLVRFNNATRSSVTAIYIDKLSNLKTDADPILKSVLAGDVIVWQDKATAANTVRYRVTGAPTNNTGWWSIPVEWMSETGSLWTANTLLSFTLHRIGTIGTNGLVNDAVTYAKIQNVTAQKVLGRVTNSSGDVEEISTTGWSATAKVVMDQSPVLVTPNIGTPSAGTLTNCTGLPTAGLVNGAVTSAKQPHGLAIVNFALDACPAIGVSTTLIPAFPTDRDAFTVNNGETYMFEGMFTISKNGGTATGKSLQFGFGGTATLGTGSVGYESRVWIGASSSTSCTFSRVSGATATTISAATSSSGAEVYNVRISGTLQPTSTGTIIPSFCWNTSPGAGATAANQWPSWFRITAFSTSALFVNMS